MSTLQQLQALLQQQQAGQLGGGPIVSFKAGKCKLQGNTVTADPRKGEVVVTKEDDGMHHFAWRTRGANPQDEDKFLLLGSAFWEKVPECKDARVFALRIGGQNGSGGNLHFYWMQEPKDDKDEQYFKKLTEILSPSGAGGGGLGLGAAGLGGLGGAGGLGALGGTGGLGGLGGIGMDDQAAILSMIQQQAAAERAQQQQQGNPSSASSSSSSNTNTESSSSGTGSSSSSGSQDEAKDNSDKSESEKDSDESS